MTSRFPGPWRIVAIANGFAVDDATGRQLGVFYGRAGPNTAGHTGFLMIDEARQVAVHFARLPELLKQTSVRGDVAPSMEDDKFAKLETSRSSQGASENSHLPRAQLPAVIGLPLVGAATTVPHSVSFERHEWRSTPLLRRPSDPLSNRSKFLIAIAVAALFGYFLFGASDGPVDLLVASQATSNIPSVEFSPLGEAQAPLLRAIGTNVENRVEPEIQTVSSQQTARLDTKPMERGAYAIPPPTLLEKGARSFATSHDASTCFPSASAAHQNHRGGWASRTLRAPGHEGARCWYATTRATAHHHRRRMPRRR